GDVHQPLRDPPRTALAARPGPAPRRDVRGAGLRAARTGGGAPLAQTPGGDPGGGGVFGPPSWGGPAAAARGGSRPRRGGGGVGGAAPGIDLAHRGSTTGGTVSATRSGGLGAGGSASGGGGAVQRHLPLASPGRHPTRSGADRRPGARTPAILVGLLSPGRCGRGGQRRLADDHRR